MGVSLLVAGGSMMASNIMSAAGVNGKVASIISSALNIVAGIALCFTPFAAMGASMIGSGIGGIAGGFISEALGGSFETGAMIGAIVGGIIGGQVYKGVQAASAARAAKATASAAAGSKSTSSAASASKNVPNPGGRHGGPAHKAKIDSIKQNLTKKGWDVADKEFRTLTPNGTKPYRYADVYATKNGQEIFINVGKATKAGLPIAREARAIADFATAGIKIIFIPYA
ncbi:hypothetical protein [Pumilibacter muris]|uniref:hypothetical protein n=1 Tax=Pumilibacter muris TaxID=2941510 RepID=UPI002041C85C|nr:hypothetical protein [Pumilibacter muris]